MIVALMIFLSAVGSTILWRMYHIEKTLVCNELVLKTIHLLLCPHSSKKQEEETKISGANRKPRTDAQKLAASERRKEWWAKKKASESSVSEAID